MQKHAMYMHMHTYVPLCRCTLTYLRYITLARLIRRVIPDAYIKHIHSRYLPLDNGMGFTNYKGIKDIQYEAYFMPA
jgi:hypothetical protein